MYDTRRAGSLAIALEHMTGPLRGSVTWLTAPKLSVTLEATCYLRVSETSADEPGTALVARLLRVKESYEIEAIAGHSVWVNREPVTMRRLKHGDVVEFGETGPMCRCRVFSDDASVRNSVADILSDIGAYLRASRQPLKRRVIRAIRALIERLSRETSNLFKFTVLAAIVIFGLLAYQQQQLNDSVRRDIENAASRLDIVSIGFVEAQNEALRPSDLVALREELEQRFSSNMTRLEELELRATANSRVIAASLPSVAFIQGAYGFREPAGDRMLRQVVRDDGVPFLSPRGLPILSFEGDGPVVELQYTGTGFVVGDGDLLITNRHVALPWERNPGTAMLPVEGVEPVMIRLVVYLPGNRKSVTAGLLRASESADIAILWHEGPSDVLPGLRLAEAQPTSGDEVIVMGYPTGLRAMLAQSGPDFIKELQETSNTGFWSIAAQLAEVGRIAPTSSRGIVGQVTMAAIVYDAETTHGASGGPVLNTNGDVIAVNSAFLPEYGGSNLGVPIAKVRELLEEVGVEGEVVSVGSPN